MVNYYHILGLSSAATQAEIKGAYRRLALRYHPDKNAGSSYAEERFKHISEAYQVLSDARKKARHDWMLEYGTFQQIQSQAGQPGTPTATGRYNPAPGTYNRSRRASRPYFNSRQNVVATAWAFGIFILLAMVVIAVSMWNSYRLQEMEAERNLQDQATLTAASRLFDTGKADSAFYTLASISSSSNYALQSLQLKESFLYKLEQEGFQLYRSGNYAEAASKLQLLADHLQVYRPVILAHLIASYEVMQDYEGAIRGYQSVIKAEPRTIEARNRLAMIYAEHYKDFDTALQYYHQASELVTNQYKSEYGTAYALTVNPARTPDSHYQLHCGMAQVYITQGLLSQAESALKWALFLRPEEPLAHYLMGIRHREARDKASACKEWKLAADKGYQQALAMLAEQCR